MLWCPYYKGACLPGRFKSARLSSELGRVEILSGDRTKARRSGFKKEGTYVEPNMTPFTATLSRLA